MYPIRDGGLVYIVPENILISWDIRVIIGSGSEVVAGDKAHLVCHYPQGTSQNGHHRYDGDHLGCFYLAGSHYL